jgi:hypothetical protein
VKRIVTTAVAFGAIGLSSISAPQPAHAGDAWRSAAWFDGGLALGSLAASSYAYGPGYGGPYYPYDWSYGHRVGYGYPYNYGPRYAFGYPYSYDPYRYADPYRYNVTYAWAGPPCYVKWARYAGEWRKARICD